MRYSTQDEAANCLQQLNGFQVMNKKLLCKLSNVSNNSHTLSTTNLYVKNIPAAITSPEQLQDMFAAHGTILDVKLKMSANSKSFGFVRFASEQEAQQAIHQLNNTQVVVGSDGDQEVTARMLVKYATEKDPFATSSPSTPTRTTPTTSTQVMSTVTTTTTAAPTTLPPQAMPAAYAMYYWPHEYPYFAPFPTNPALPPNADPFKMYSHPPATATISPNTTNSSNTSTPTTPTSSNTHHHHHHANAAVLPPNNQDANLFVFHLPPDMSDNHLYQLFAQFGPIESVKVILDKVSGESKGYGFVKFYLMQDAIQAISQMNGYKLGKKHLKVSFKTSAPPNVVSLSHHPQQQHNHTATIQATEQQQPTTSNVLSTMEFK